MGSALLGLEAVYLCIPNRVEANRITGWAFTHPLWLKDSAMSNQPPAPLVIAADAFPEEIYPEAEVRKKRRTNEEG